MEPLPQEPRDFREIVESDLRRAARLIIKVQDALDLQWRIATPNGDWHLATTLPADDLQMRENIFRAAETFMHWKQAFAFTLASELIEPDCLACWGVSAHEKYVCRSLIARQPKPWTADNFSSVEWLPEDSIDPILVSFLPAPVQAELAPEFCTGA